MPSYSLTHLADAAVLRGLTTLVAQDRATTAALLAHLAEVDARKLYLSAAYHSMMAYCIGELRFSEDSAAKRIQAARAAHRCPALFTALAQGRLHLAATVLLSPHISPDNAQELIEAASHKTKAEIERLLAERSPKLEMPSQVWSVDPALPTECAHEHAPGHVDVQVAAPTRLADSGARAGVSACSAERYAIRATISQAAHDDLRHAQELLAHRPPSGDVGEVLERALRVLVEKLERRKFAATTQPRAPRPSRSRQRGRHIPANVRRAVWERDRGQCTFVSGAGRRCESRRFLEFDHAEPVGRGGESSVANLRLRCRAHNQFMAERTYGAEFMRQKREKARERAAERSRVRDCETELAPCLEQLGYRRIEIRRAAEHCATLPGVSIEQRVRAAIRILSPVRPSRVLVAAPSSAQSPFTASTSLETAPLASPNSIEQRGS